MGIQLSDVYSFTLPELSEAVEQWQRYEEARYRASWEQARFIVQKMLLPYSKKKLDLTDVARFAWEDAEPTPDVRAVSKEDYNRMLKRFGES